MFGNILLGLLIMLICLGLQVVLVVLVVRFYARHEHLAKTESFVQSMTLIGSVMMVLVLGNFIQIIIWAALFVYLGEFSSFATAVYHSAVNFATLGYGDIVMSEDRRLLGPMESINGVLMVGVSTAVVMSGLQNALKVALQQRQTGDSD